MARVRCRWWNFLICLCTPCILLALLFTYVALMLCYNMASITSATTLQDQIKKIHFIAPGTYRNEGLAPLPTRFWDPEPHGGALWNRLQLEIDRYNNPILTDRRTTRERKRTNSSYNDVMKASFSAIGDLKTRMSDFAKLPEQMKEFVSSMHRREYPNLILPRMPCGVGLEDEKESPLLLLAIKSVATNFERRQVIRQTWGQVGWVAGQRKNGNVEGEVGKSGGYVRRVFLLAKLSRQEMGADLSDDLLQLESRHYGDILQWDFKDSFFNLTLKDVHFWDWFSRHCKRARFVFKGDDDVFVNTPAMLDYLLDQEEKLGQSTAMRGFMAGEVIGAAIPNRVIKSKYFVPESFYKGLYPAYAGGGGVVYSGQLTKLLNQVSKTVHLFPIDDVYVGMCMIKLKAAYPTHHPAFLTFDFPKKEEEQQPCAHHKILLVHKRSPDQVIQLWSELKEKHPECWNATLRTTEQKTMTTKSRQVTLKRRKKRELDYI